MMRKRLWLNSPDSILTAKVEVTELMGSETYLYLLINGINFIARVNPVQQLSLGTISRFALIWRSSTCLIRELKRQLLTDNYKLQMPAVAWAQASYFLRRDFVLWNF